MSNYPPGVTGNEYEIAGPDREWEDEDFKCDNDEFEYVMITPFAFQSISKLVSKYSNVEEMEKIREHLYYHFSHINACINHSSITTEVQYAKCGYAGSVVKQSYRDDIWWDCPQCGKTYEEKVEDYYDED